MSPTCGALHTWFPSPRKTHQCVYIESDLRPVSVTPITSKALEHFICKWVQASVAPNIHPRQYGAVQGSSTIYMVTEMLHFIQRNLDRPGQYVRGLPVDFSTAFDRVNHNILLEKMCAGTPAYLVEVVCRLPAQSSALCAAGLRNVGHGTHLRGHTSAIYSLFERFRLSWADGCLHLRSPKCVIPAAATHPAIHSIHTFSVRLTTLRLGPAPKTCGLM